MRTIPAVLAAALMVPGILRAQPVPQPACPLECNCANRFQPPEVAGFGLQDNFALPPEPVSFPTSPLASDLTACGATLLNFDDIPGENAAPANAWFAAEIAGIGFICDARIEVHVRATTGAGSDGTDDDRIHLIQTGSGCPVGFAWSALLRDLPAANGQWIPGQDATFCLDLAALPVAGGGTVNGIYEMTFGRVEVAVEDDSGVDSIIASLCAGPEAVTPCDWSTVKRLYH